jgi:hypothetical protein
MPETAPTPRRTAARLFASVLLLTILLVSLSITAVRSLLHEEAEYDRGQDLLSRQRDADRLVMVELESIRAETGRYPAILPVPRNPRHDLWNYRATEDGSDYELWCTLPGAGSSFDGLVFSPDGVVSPDWPAAVPVQGTAWSIIPHAERAPADRWAPPPPPAAPASPTVR